MRELSFRLLIEPTILEFDTEDRERYKNEDRTKRSDPYSRKYKGTNGFGENFVGRYFERRGYKWIHHDFDLFGLNKPNKYPLAQAILTQAIGKKKLDALKVGVEAMKPLREARRAFVEAPDLLLYRTDPIEVRFAECKRADTSDKLNPRQLLGFMLIGAVLRCPIDVFVLRERGKSPRTAPFAFDYPATEV